MIFGHVIHYDKALGRGFVCFGDGHFYAAVYAAELKGRAPIKGDRIGFSLGCFADCGRLVAHNVEVRS